MLLKARSYNAREPLLRLARRQLIDFQADPGLLSELGRPGQLSESPPTRHEVPNDRDEREDQQDVDSRRGNVEDEKAAQPEQKQDDTDGKEHE